MWQQITDYLHRLYLTVGWRDVLELLFIAAVIYFLYSGLRRTRGARVVRGFVFLLVTTFVVVKLFAEYLDLHRVSWLYEHLVLYAVFAALIIFQPELRRSLVRLGQNPLLRFFLKPEALVLVDKIVRAADVLSRNRIGALIAIERETGLSALAETGVPVDAEVTPQLLTTIFWPGSALHDMGVIIREGRVATAACEFPLASHALLDAHLGTRHRAAVGLTEETDAIVVVVSGERGDVSVAVNGKLEKALELTALRKRLTELLQMAEEEGPPVREAPAKVKAPAEDETVK
ncbi:MAG: diadenylate cyclase CdaA [Phycisphaerae bacterium]|jgi:diadenylate cyclase|nr:diadenylate cyclase CdaA [Phycisphaerae bacterium]